MPASSRNEVAEKHRTQRRVNSPYNQDRRKEKLAASRGWKPTIWKALMFWKHDPSPSSSSSSSDEDSDSIESPENGNGQSSQNNRRNGTKDVVDVHEDGASAEESNDALSAMNSSTVSEDQVLRQLVSPIPRQVRFQLPSHSHHSTHISQNHNQNQNQNQFQRPSAASASSSLRRSSPYVAPLPPSSTLMQMQMGQQYKDPLATVSDYLDNVVLPRGGECTNVEALGLSMLIQSSVKGLASSPSPAQETTPSVLTRSPFVFPTANSPIPLKPTFTTPNTDFAAIFSRPDSSSTTTLTTSTTTSTKPASSSSTSSSSSTTTARMLTRNPNGNVFFQGGGSAKPRYRSPAFGAPSSRRKITFGDSRVAENGGGGSSVAGDGKRRRVGEESYLSVAQPSGPPSTSLSSSSALYTVHESSAMDLDLDSHSQEGVNGSTLSNGVNSSTNTSTSSSAAPQTTSLRFGTSAARFTSTPARPSPLRQSVRADSSSPGSPSSIHRNQDQSNSGSSSTPEVSVKTNGGAGNHDVAKAGQAKALAIFAEIVSSASQPNNDDKTLAASELVNPYDTRPPTKRARRPAKSARPPPPRPTRRVVSTEGPPPPPVSPKKPTALETIEKSAPASVQQAKRMHAEVNGNISPEKASKRPDREEREVIEIDDEEEEANDDEDLQQQPPSKKAKPEKPTPTPTPTLVEVIDVDNDIDMSEETVSDSTPVVRPSEVIEPVTDSDRAIPTTQPVPPRSPSPSKSTLPSRTLYPTSLSKGPGRFGTAPKEPSPLRNSFQPEEENATSKREETTSTNFFMPKFAQPESKAVPVFFNTGSTVAAETTTTAVDDVASSAPSAGLFSKAPKSSEFVVPSTSPSEVPSESLLGKMSRSSPFSVFTVPVPEKPVANAAATTTTTTTGTNGFTFGQTSVATSTFGDKSFSFGAGSSKPTLPTATFPKLPSSSGPALSSIKTKTDDIEVIKWNVISVKETELPVFNFNVTTTVSGTRDQSACAAALGVPETSLPTFKFDKKVVSSTLAFGTGAEKQSSTAPASYLTVPPSKTEAKGFDFAAAGMKAPVSAGWTCSMCFVPNKDTDSKCACCGEDKP